MPPSDDLWQEVGVRAGVRLAYILGASISLNPNFPLLC